MCRSIKIQSRLWNNQQFRELSDQAKLAYFFLTTHPHLTAVGAMRGTLVGLADELGWSCEAFTKAFRELSELGLVKIAERAPLICLPGFLEDNQAESPNVVKSWATALESLPQCPEFMALISDLREIVTGWGDAYRKAFAQAIVPCLPESAPKMAVSNPSRTESHAELEASSEEPLPKPLNELNSPLPCRLDPQTTAGEQDGTPDKAIAAEDQGKAVESPVRSTTVHTEENVADLQAVRHELFLRMQNWMSHFQALRSASQATLARRQAEQATDDTVQKSVAVAEQVSANSTSRIPLAHF